MPSPTGASHRRTRGDLQDTSPLSWTAYAIAASGGIDDSSLGRRRPRLGVHGVRDPRQWGGGPRDAARSPVPEGVGQSCGGQCRGYVESACRGAPTAHITSATTSPRAHPTIRRARPTGSPTGGTTRSSRSAAPLFAATFVWWTVRTIAGSPPPFVRSPRQRRDVAFDGLLGIAFYIGMIALAVHDMRLLATRVAGAVAVRRGRARAARADPRALRHVDGRRGTGTAHHPHGALEPIAHVDLLGQQLPHRPPCGARRGPAAHPAGE